MKNQAITKIILALVILIGGCSYYNKVTSVFRSNNKDNLKARLTVADFDARAAKADNKIASALRQMLIDSLSSSKRIVILERNDANAELIVTAEITEFEHQASGGRSGIGGGGGSESGAFAGLLGESGTKAFMSLNIRLVDIHSSQVLASARMRGQVMNVPGKNKMQGGLLKGDLAVFSNTPMEKAISECINESSRYINNSIPERYYKY